MATRLPQVRVGGKNRQMPAGDAVPVAAGGTGATSAAAALAALGGVPMAITGTQAKTDLVSDAPVGRWVSYLTITGGGADWPTALTVGYWNVFTFGVASRATQIAQEALATGTEQGGLFVRTRHDSTWTPWRRLASHAEAVASVAAGVMDCAIANTFSAAISANTTLSFSNIPSGAYSCVLEISHTGGAITMPSGTVWVGGTPIFTAGTSASDLLPARYVGHGRLVCLCARGVPCMAAAPLSQAMNPAMMAAMEQRMRAMHEKMAAAKTPQERKALMAEHMKTMQDGMRMMESMPGQMASGNPPAGMAGMQHDPQMMEKRMAMMESMMQMMMDRMSMP